MSMISDACRPGGLLALALLGFSAAPIERASAITAEVARKCDALVSKAYPPRQPGNPAAGSSKGSGRVQRDYFNKCVANGGTIDEPERK